MFKVVLPLVIAVCAFNAQAGVITDNYIGADRHNYTDVIGDSDKFDVLSAEVSKNGTLLTVDIYTTFTDNVGAYWWLTRNWQGIGLGDLFLSTEWNPYGSDVDGYQYDDARNGTKWSYGFSINNRYTKYGQSGSGVLYQLNGATNDSNALLSQDYMGRGAVFRNGQEVTVDRSANVSAIAAGDWFINNQEQLFSMTFDVAGTALENAEQIGLHWSMLCGNDVIEGLVDMPRQVPEPAGIVLAMFCMLGLAAARKYR